ncbi:MAG TPA: hypothetical protein VEA69_14495 [Tepidisphaeraceae bacterium]|nr:hypothetical protein [Tepidisphaeraceae bacterium]
MLNQIDDRRIGLAAPAPLGAHDSDWCVGEPAGRWDVSFGARVAEKLKQWLRLEAAQTVARRPVMKVVAREPVAVRKAA